MFVLPNAMCPPPQYYRLTSDNIADGYPKRISADWAGLPNNVDAAFTWQDTGATYIFKVNTHLFILK